MLTRTIIAALVLAALLSCSKDSELLLKDRTVTTIGTNGGRATSADGSLELYFALGSLTADTPITIDTIREGRDVPNGRSPVYVLSPDGLVFDRPVAITIHAEPNDAIEELAIANVDGAYPAVLEDSVWDRDAGFIRANLQHFSSYAAVAVYNPCAGKPCGDGCTICDPMNTSCVEPPPASKGCNRSGLCVDTVAVMCVPQPDSGIEDTGIEDTGMEDTGVEDTGVEDAGVDDTGVPSCTDTFTQNAQPVVDVLIIMDDSCSMYEEQATLAQSFDLLRTTLVNNNTDFHIGVTSTDVDPTGAQGQLIGTPTWLSSTTPSLDQVFAMHVSLGVNGSGFEQGLEAARLALTPPANPGFLRDNSSLTVIYVSDEEDQSPDMSADYAQFLINLRGARRVQANAIVAPDPMGCTGPNGFGDPGTRYIAVRSATGGAFDEICTPPWNNALTDLGGPGFGYLYRFQLTSMGTAVISVTVDGVPLPELDGMGNPNWVFDSGDQTIEFSEDKVPGPGATVVVVTSC